MNNINSLSKNIILNNCFVNPIHFQYIDQNSYIDYKGIEDFNNFINPATYNWEGGSMSVDETQSQQIGDLYKAVEDIRKRLDTNRTDAVQSEQIGDLYKAVEDLRKRVSVLEGK